jgi:hypothetical protein
MKKRNMRILMMRALHITNNKNRTMKKLWVWAVSTPLRSVSSRFVVVVVVVVTTCLLTSFLLSIRLLTEKHLGDSDQKLYGLRKAKSMEPQQQTPARRTRKRSRIIPKLKKLKGTLEIVFDESLVSLSLLHTHIHTHTLSHISFNFVSFFFIVLKLLVIRNSRQRIISLLRMNQLHFKR